MTFSDFWVPRQSAGIGERSCAYEARPQALGTDERAFGAVDVVEVEERVVFVKSVDLSWFENKVTLQGGLAT